MSHTVYLAFGSNLGNREKTIKRALDFLDTEGLKPVRIAPCIATEPEGFVSGNRFLNTVGEFGTILSPRETLEATQRVERLLGRTRKSHDGIYHDRTIDIDILFYDDIAINTPDLCIPHRAIGERLFVLRPLCAIAPDLRHPVCGKTMAELLEILEHRA